MGISPTGEYKMNETSKAGFQITMIGLGLLLGLLIGLMQTYNLHHAINKSQYEVFEIKK